jgi:hypothetical protein
MSKRRKGALVIAAAVVAMFGTFIPGAHADIQPIGGFQMKAEANAISLIYDQPSFGLPAEHTFDLHKSHAVTAMDSGPSGHAQASVLWPGDLAGNAPLDLAIGLFVQDPTSARYLDCSGEPHQCIPVIDKVVLPTANQLIDAIKQGNGGNSPSYPFKAESFYPAGPADDKYAAGAGIVMSSHADEKLTQSSSVVQEGGVPGALDFGLMRSSTISGVIDGKAVSEARSSISDINILGQLKIGNVNSFMQVISDGAKATVQKSIVVTGLSIGGQPIVVDSNGFHAGGQTQDPLGTISKELIDKYLTPNGISIKLGRPTVKTDQAMGSSTGSGLIVSLSSFGMQQVVAQMPDPFKGWLQSPSTSPLSPVTDQLSSFVNGLIATPFQFDQTLTFLFGDVSVNADAAPAYVVPPVSVGPVAQNLPPTPATQLPTGNFGGPTAPPPQVQGIQRFLPKPVAAVAIPIGLFLLALAFMFGGATALDRMAGAATSSVAVETCPLEKP